MRENPFITLDAKGVVLEAGKETAGFLGIPLENLIGRQLIERIIPEHKVRFSAELEALSEGNERHGRLHCTIIGLDGIGRRLTLAMSKDAKGSIRLGLLPYQHPESVRKAPGSALIDSGRLLPVARRIAAISQRASSKEELLSNGLEVLAEVTSAEAGAALEWGDQNKDRPVVTIGSFNPYYLHGLFRPAILSRLTRGDVVVKEATLDGRESDTCLIIVPLLATSTPLGIIALSISGYSVLVPEEQQCLLILGEILGLGLKALTTSTRSARGSIVHRGDTAASVALGRLSAGLAHEISNAATILRNNFEQIMLRSDGYGYGLADDFAVKDSMAALDAICDLNDALRAFAPEETHLQEEVDLLRILDIVARAVRFYAKRGMSLTLDRPEDIPPLVRVRSHYLIRSLFLILVELTEASLDAGMELDVRLNLMVQDDFVTLTITVTAGPFSLPTMLLVQLEKGGALNRYVTQAGGKLTHDVDHKGNLCMAIALPNMKNSAKPKRHSPATLPPRRGTILIADDEIAVIRSLRRLLERDHDVLAARSGEEALEIIRANNQIDVILYDVSMPRLQGPEFFDALQRTRSSAADRIIFVTGGVADAEVSRFLKETKNPILEKPFNLLLLNDYLAMMLK
jgi:CheY-like chemotaxis protein